MRTMLRTAAPLLGLLAACPGDDGTCPQPGSACEVVDADACAERLVCPEISASAAGGTPYLSGGMYVDGFFQRQRASVTIYMTRLPAVGQTTTWKPESTGDFEMVIVERYGDSTTFPLPVTHAAGHARAASPTGPARPAQGSVSVHLESIS